MRETKDWFSEHRGFFFGLAVVLVALNIVFFIVLPQQRTVQLQQTVTEYSLDDENYCEERELTFSGTLSTSVLAQPEFDGTLCIEGLEGLSTPCALSMKRQDGAWVATFTDESGNPTQTAVTKIGGDRDLSDLAFLCQGEDGSVHIIVPDAGNRRAALYQAQSCFGALTEEG